MSDPPPGRSPSGATPAAGRPSRGLLKEIGAFGTATLHEAAGKKGSLPSQIKPISHAMRVCGTATTVQSPPADNLWLHRAIYTARKGDVLVVNVSGHHEAGYFGEIMAYAARERGLGGVVIDGCVRDGERLAEIGMPVFARGLCIRGTGKDHEARGMIGQPITIGEVFINQGDVVVGDSDGVVVLDPSCLGSIAAMAGERERNEAEIVERIRNGVSTLEIYGWGNVEA